MADEYVKLVKIGLDQSIINASIANADKLTAEIKALTAAQKESGIQDAETTAKIKALTLERNKDLEVLKQANILTNAATKSNAELRAQLSLLTGQYNKLSKEERENTAAGLQMGRTIKSITDELKSNESAIGDNRRNVGNYKDALSGMLGSLGGMIPALKGVKIGQMGVNTAMAANPVGALVQLFSGLVSMFKSNAGVADQLTFAMSAMNKVFSSLIDMVVNSDIGKAIGKLFTDPVQGIKDFGNLIVDNIINRFKAVGVIVRAVLDGDLKALGDGLLQAGTGVTGMSDKLKGLGKSLGDAAKEGYNAAKALDDIVVANARTTAAIKANQIQTEALTKSLKDRTKSEQERIAIANKIADTEIASAELARKLAVDILAAEKMKLKGRELAAEDTAKLIELESNVLQAETEKQIANSQRQTRINILLDKEARDAAKESSDTSIADAEKEAERLKQIADDFARSRMADNDRRLLEIEERSAVLRKAGVAEVEIQKWKNEEIEKIDMAAKAEAFTRQVELLNGQEQLDIQAAQLSITNETELQNAKYQIALDFATKRLALMREQAMLDGILTEQEIQNLTKVENTIKGIQQTLANPDAPTAAESLGLSEQQISDMQLGLDVISGLLQSIQQATQAAADNKIAAIDQEAEAEKKAIENSTLSEKEKKEKITAIDKKAAMEKYKIELAQFKVAKGLQIGLAIANTATAVMAQLSNPTPYAGFVLAALAAVTGGVQIGIISAQKPPSPPAFAKGGYISGAGTGTSDSIDARLSNGESVNNAKTTAMFAPILSAMNKAGGGVDWYRGEGFSNGGIVKKFAAGGIAVSSSALMRENEQAATLQQTFLQSQPVLVIEEFQSVQGRQVRTEQNLSI